MISLISPVKTRAHSWPAGFKLSALCLCTLALFSIDSFIVFLVCCFIVTGLYLLPGKAFAKHGFSQLRILWPFVVIVLIWHLWIAELVQGGIIVMRMLCAVALANLVTMTTKLSDMIDVIQSLTRPLARLGLNPRVLELSIALVIRMTPVLLNKGHHLNSAWRARAKRRAGWRIILPFTLIALDDADHVAEAIRARGGLTHPEKK